MTSSTRTMERPDAEAVPVTVDDRGTGRPFLLLHGGAGPDSVGGFAALLAEDARVLTPTHPGFDGTPRAGLDSIGALARLYADLLADLGLTGVTVIGNSIGGWIAAELALLGRPEIGGVVLVNAVGLALDDHPIVDFFSLTFDQVVERSYYAPEAFRPPATPPTAARQAIIAGNRDALATYGGTSMADPSLLGRLPAIAVPTLVVWGAADRIAPPEHGEAYAAAIPGARLEVITRAGHLPQLETPAELAELVRAFAALAVERG